MRFIQRTSIKDRCFDAVGFVGLGIVIGLAFATLLTALESLYGMP